MSFRRALEAVINRYSREAVSNTPDFILADYVLQALDAFDLATRARDEWYGFDLKPGKSTRKRCEKIQWNNDPKYRGKKV